VHDLAILLKTANLYAHSAHNLTCGPSFFADHKQLAKFYEDYIEAYDSIIERIIGLYGRDNANIIEVTVQAVDKFKVLPLMVPTEDRFKTLLEIEKEIYSLIAQLEKHPEITCGTNQLITEIANQSEIRQYLIKQRLS